MMKLCSVTDHQNKSTAYREALAKAGYTFTDRLHAQGLRFILTDADWRVLDMEKARRSHIPVFLYPHAARPMVQYDGCIEARPVTAMFTHAEGGKELMEIIGYPYPVEVAGWAYSEIRPFRKAEKAERILFAPIHPNANGWLSQVDKDLNRRTYRALYDMCQKTGARLSIRLIGTQTGNGLDNVPAGDFVEWHSGKKNLSTADIECADVVVAHQTFAYLAVALGVPTVMMGEDVPPRTGNSEDSFQFVAHWEAYRSLLAFPLDILHGDPENAVRSACEGSDAVEEWKARFIGKPFDGPAFVAKLESYL